MPRAPRRPGGGARGRGRRGRQRLDRRHRRRGRGVGGRRSGSSASPARAARRSLPGAQPRLGTRPAARSCCSSTTTPWRPRAGWRRTWPRTTATPRWPARAGRWCCGGPRAGPAGSLPELEHWYSALDLGDDPATWPTPHGPYGTNMSVRRSVLAEVGGFDRAPRPAGSQPACRARRPTCVGACRRPAGAHRLRARDPGAAPGDARPAVSAAGCCDGAGARAGATPGAGRGPMADDQAGTGVACAGPRPARRPGTSATSHGRPPRATGRRCSTPWPARSGHLAAALELVLAAGAASRPGGGRVPTEATAGRAGITRRDPGHLASRDGQGAAVGYQLGVDLGTTYTAAAVIRNGQAEVATLGTRSLEIPSVVLPARRRRAAHRRGRRAAQPDRARPLRPRVQAPHRRPHAGAAGRHRRSRPTR